MVLTTDTRPPRSHQTSRPTSRRRPHALTRIIDHDAPRAAGPFLHTVDAASITKAAATVPSARQAPATTTTLPEAARQYRRERGGRRCRIIAVANQKGGSGKTSTVLALAGALAEEGFRVLIVDIDEQCNATDGLGETASESGSYYILMDDEADAAQAVVVTKHDNIHLIPAHPKLSEVPTALAGPDVLGAHAFLSDALNALRDNYDFILIDCPPSLQLVTINGLFSADEVFVPVNPGFFDLKGLAKLNTTIKRVRTRLQRPQLDIRHVICINFSARAANSRTAYEALRGAFGDRVIDTAEPDPAKQWYGSGVPTDGKISSSHSAGVPITAYDKRSRAATAYRTIAAVVLQRGTDRG